MKDGQPIVFSLIAHCLVIAAAHWSSLNTFPIFPLSRPLNDRLYIHNYCFYPFLLLFSCNPICVKFTGVAMRMAD